MEIKLTNQTKKFCVIGDPVTHSKSPAIYNAMAKVLGVDMVYLCQPVKVDELEQFIQSVKLLGYGGFNATMPHKECLVQMVDHLDSDSEMCQSVNTVRIIDGELYGSSTDGGGFFHALLSQGCDPRGKNVVILGAGGAAKSVALKLVEQGVQSLVVANRSIDKAELLCKHNLNVMQGVDFQIDTLNRVMSECDVLVNCTSLGMEESAEFSTLEFLDHLPTHAMVCDLIYHPAETKLLEHARLRGLVTMNGLGMLIHQAILAMELFLGESVDRQAMEILVKEQF